MVAFFLFFHSGLHDALVLRKNLGGSMRDSAGAALTHMVQPFFRDGQWGQWNFRKLEPHQVWYLFPSDGRTSSTVLLTRKILRTSETRRHEGVITYPQLLPRLECAGNPNQPA